jgi:hypothetical protein
VFTEARKGHEQHLHSARASRHILAVVLPLRRNWRGCFAGIGYAIGSGKERATEGLVLGLILGFIGVIIIAVMSDRNADMVRSVEATRQRAGPGWHLDPFQRHEMRYFDGFIWSGDVSDSGVVSTDVSPDSAQATVPVPSTVTVPDAYLPSRPRKWDKATKRWLRQEPSGKWIPED